MNSQLQQRILELCAIVAMIAGIILMWMRMDAHHILIYVGFFLLATGKLMEALRVTDPGFKIMKVSALVCIYLLIILNISYGIRSLSYIMIPLVIYYILHYRWALKKKTYE
ncbi:MAG: hypothetical protein JST46_11605 [Bacteroidetes bacterium]|nr:hypothetical protein [Bacteroidota bacterium]